MNLRDTVSSVALLANLVGIARDLPKKPQRILKAISRRIERRKARASAAKEVRHHLQRNNRIAQAVGLGRRQAITRALAIGITTTALDTVASVGATATPALPFGHVLQAGAIGDGAAHNHDALVKFDNAGGGFYLSNTVSPSTYYVEANLTLKHRAIMAPGAIIKPAAGVTITLTELVVLDELTQCFDVSAGGSFVLPTGFVPTPHMFGVDPTGATDSSPAVNAAISSSASTGEIYFPAGTLKFSVTTTENIPHYFHGAGENTVCIPLGPTQPCFIVRRNTNLRKVRIEFMTFQDPGTQTCAGIWNAHSLFETRGLHFLSLKYGMIFNAAEWSKHSDNVFGACLYWIYITTDYKTGTYDPLGFKAINFGSIAQNPSEHTFINFWGQAVAAGHAAVSVYQEDGDASYGDRGTTKLKFEGLTKFFLRQSLIVISNGNPLNGPGAVTLDQVWLEGGTGTEPGLTIAGTKYPNNAIYVSGCSLTIRGDAYGLIAGKAPIYVKYGTASDLSAPPSLTVDGCMLAGNPFIIDKGIFSRLTNCSTIGQANGDFSNFTIAENVIPARGDVRGGSGTITASSPPLVTPLSPVQAVGAIGIVAGGIGHAPGDRLVLTNGIVLRVLTTSRGTVTSGVYENAFPTSVVVPPIQVLSTSGIGRGAAFSLSYTSGPNHTNIWQYASGHSGIPAANAAKCSAMSIVSGAGTSGKMLAITMAPHNGSFTAGAVALAAGQAVFASVGLQNMGSADALLYFHGLGCFPPTTFTVPADGDLHHYTIVAHVGMSGTATPGLYNFGRLAARLQLEYGQIIIFSAPTTAGGGNGALAKAVKFGGAGHYVYPAIH